MSRLPSLRERSLTYDEVGITFANDWAAQRSDLTKFDRAVCLGNTDGQWEIAARRVLDWSVKTRSGFEVVDAHGHDASSSVGPVGQRTWLIAHLGPLRIWEPVQVVAVIDEPARKGFAYGTLSGHPLAGEEAFIVERKADGSVWFSLRSASRPSPGPWRLAHPALRLAQTWYRRRYLRVWGGSD